jgi:asparagine synthase (glutamine-hydrolysing)
MCGICGFNWDNNDLIKSMTKILTHRGPDLGGIYSDEMFSLGHRRLSIIDLSDDGNQPMYNEKGDLIIIYNGEVYNFKEIKNRLKSLGHRFSSRTDTEVVLHAYEEWGLECLHKFNGMFAFCIYDLNKKRLFLARDRLGIKPLYYYLDKDNFIFASEIKSILLAYDNLEILREIDLSAAKEYLNLRYISGNKTLFNGIKKLLPGQYAIFENNELNISEYWDVPVPEKEKISLNGATNKVNELLNDSVKKRLIADVPVGVYLSGGIDSAAITALAAKQKEEAVKTFSVGFDYNDEVDELNKARKIAEHFSTDHHEITINENISPLLPKLIWQLDMPHGDPVIIPQFKLSELASKKVKVVLSGEGADEIFAGYVQYKTFMKAQKAKLIPSFVGSSIINNVPVKVLDQLFDYPSSIGEKGKEKAKDLIEDINDNEKSYEHLTSIMSKKDNDLLFSDNVKDIKLNKLNFDNYRKPLLNQMLYYDIKKWLPNYILFINDRMTMANSIEGRVPFLDHRLVEFVNNLPVRYKLNGNITKFILRKSMKNILPNAEIKKHAFFMPLDRWYENELKSLLDELFSSDVVRRRGYFRYYYLKKIWKNYEKSKLIYGKQLFTLINFELWHRIFLDPEKIPLNNNIKLNKLI